MQTPDITESNIEKIGQLFPNCLTERIGEDGKVEQVIDFDRLRQELSKEIVEGPQERYQFTWPDKKKAIRLANTPSNMTLRPCREESVDFDNTENLYIEGDNLEVLKLLREDYLGKVKFIYIDPPYNTGNEFVYNDEFVVGSPEWDMMNNRDEFGNKLPVNSDANGRFHTDWLNMIFPRLRVAKDLLSEDGAIFISIGQEEICNLISICDEVFGSANREGIISRQMKSGGNQGKSFSKNVDYILVYAKNTNCLAPFREPLEQELKESIYNKIEQSGPRKGEKYRLMGLYQAGLNDWRPNQKYFIKCPDGSEVIPPCSVLDEVMREGDGRWRWSKPRFEEELEKNNVEFVKTSTSPLLNRDGTKSQWNIYTKIWLSDREEEGRIPIDLITKLENRHSSLELKKLEIPFDFAKPTGLITKLIGYLHDNQNITVLDFFSGSASTADAVLRMNANDNGCRKFIMIQLPEPTDEKSEAFKSGFKNICEIGKERIRRAGKIIMEEQDKAKSDGNLFEEAGFKDKLDIGFRVLKLDSSNMNDIYYKPEEFNEQLIKEDNVKEGRTPEDLLFQVMLECNLPLSAKIQTEKIAGKGVFSVNNGYLVACFDENITEDVIKAIAKRKPYYFVMRDSSLASDNVADNFEQIFNAYSKDTIRRII